MKKYVLLLILLSSYTVTDAQLLKVGFRLEPTLFFNEKFNSSSLGFSPYGFYSSIIVNPIENLSLEFRPGYLVGIELYGGLELGGYAQWKILSSNFYLAGGFYSHSNHFTSYHNGGVGYENRMNFLSLGMGYQRTETNGIDIMYSWTNEKEYAPSSRTNSKGEKIYTNRKMNGILKIGISFAWDIFKCAA